jgi:N-acyl-phosphatidylethanolamine-hydrolysing phospholipase D
MPIADEIIPRMKPTWGDDQAGNEGKIKVTWMGHAAALAEMPLDPTRQKAAGQGGNAGDAASVMTDPKEKAGKKERGVTILFDPAFSKKCSPTQWFGSTRYQRESEHPNGVQCDDDAARHLGS